MASLFALNLGGDREALSLSSRTLRAAGLRVLEADNRPLALALSHRWPNLVVFDSRVDRDLVDEVCRALQADGRRAIPILELVAHGDADLVATDRPNGLGRARLHWPAGLEVVRATIGVLLPNARADSGAATATAGGQALEQAVAACQVDPRGKVVAWDEAAERFFGWTAAETLGEKVPFLTDAHNADVLALLPRAATGRPACRPQAIVCGKDRRLRVVAVSLVPFVDTAGDVTQVQVIVAETDASASANDHADPLSAIVLASQDLICIVDRRGITEFVNPAGHGLCALPAQTSSSFDLRRLLAPASRRRLLQVVLPRAASDGLFQCELAFVGGDGLETPVSVQAIRLGGHGSERIAVVARDISAKKKAEARLVRLNRTLQVLSRCGQVIQDESDETAMLAAVCRLLTETGSYRFAFAGLLGGEGACEVVPVAWSGEQAVSADELVSCWSPETPVAGGPVAAAVRTGRAIVRHGLTRPKHAPCADLKKRLGLRAMVALPLTAGDGCLGALSVYSSRADLFDAEEVGLLQDLARQVAHALQALRERVARRRAETSHRLLAAAFESTQEGIMITDAVSPEHPVVYVNAAVSRISGWAAGELIGRSGRLLAEGELHQTEMDVTRRALRGRSAGQAVLRCYRKDGQPFWSEVRVAPVRDADDGEVTHYVSLISDVTRRVYHEDQLAHLATHDLLTGLANRTLLYDRLRQALVHAERYGKLVAVLLFDLDHFRQVNERVGRGVGDLLLQSIARRLTAIAKDSDTMARLGSDEFVLLLADREAQQQVTSAAEMLLEVLTPPLWVGSEEFLVTPSIGAAISPLDTSDAEDLLRLADIAMSAAKAAGRNTFRFYAPEMALHTLRQTELTHELRRAIERQELVLHYQPKADLYSGNCTGVEALVRWQHRERGLIPPGEFIPLAEASGQIVAIGRWVLQEACRDIARWRASGVLAPRVAVNLSPQQLTSDDLISEVSSALAASGAVARQLELEVTESTVMDNPETAARTLRDLREMGVRLAMDDFGTGHSSLGNLRRFPFDVLKIDRSFVNNVTTEPQDAAIAATVIAMAHSLGLKVIAEGVESESQVQWLRDHLCDEIQGYYLSRPVPAAQIMPLLSSPQPLLSTASESLRPQRTLLLVDDEADILRALKRLLRRSGYHILATTSATQALDLLARQRVQVIVSDQRMPEMNGSEFLRRARALYPDTVRIMLTGYSDPDTMAEAINRGAISKFLTKPWDDEELRAAIHEAFVAYDQRLTHRSGLSTDGSPEAPT